ncbi:hypothetical protein NC652_036002 [Populus alba x Populus x berolinensis]|nr:hypothetical protein NC652_036002 [Populus alba x Populus x berolinensis]
MGSSTEYWRPNFHRRVAAEYYPSTLPLLLPVFWYHAELMDNMGKGKQGVVSVSNESLNGWTKIEAVAGRCSIANVYQKTGAAQLEIPVSDKSACDSDTLTEDQEYMKEIKELHAYIP